MSKKVMVKIKTTGGYTGMKNVKLPLTLPGVHHFGCVDVSLSELIYHGYDFAAGQADEIPDCSFMSESLTFLLAGEAEIVG